MTPTELRAILGRLHITQGAAARVLGLHEVTVRSWASPDARGLPRIPVTAAALLRLLDAGKLSTADIEAARREPGGED